MPVMINASYHPHVATITGTNRGVARAPTFVPALNIPVASERSFLGNHSDTVLIDAGKVARLTKTQQKPDNDEAQDRSGCEGGYGIKSK